MKVRVSQIIAPSFFKLWEDMNSFSHKEYWLKGGRGSTKSSVISLYIICGILRDKNANAVIFRKHKTDIRDSVYEQILWAINKLDLQEYFYATTNPMQITFKPTGQKIIFRGLDDAGKSKSIKVAKGILKFIWFEELDQFNGMQEIQTVLLSTVRGGTGFQVFYSYNPPESSSNWVNVESNNYKKTRLVNSSTYLTVPKEWLGEDFIEEANYVKHYKPNVYNHVYLGKVTGTGSEIFSNVEERHFTQNEINQFQNVCHGLDFGFATDPATIISCSYDHKRDCIYIFGEWYKHGAFNDDIWINGIHSRHLDRKIIMADCAEPKSIAEINRYGASLLACHKYKDSVEQGIVWLRRLRRIYIDSRLCPNAWREFSQYEYVKLRDGTIKNEYPDLNNHTIDATRYALEQFIQINMGSRVL